jgi:phosphohistidine swiveling domain-containing protein
MATMVRTSPLHELERGDRAWAGSKAVRLGQLTGAGFRVPPGVVIGAGAYHRFIDETGIASSITRMFHRKSFDEMRWEELWDLALRIRNLFARTALPATLRQELALALPEELLAEPVVVRSAGLSEDSAAASFAGLHESFVDVRGRAQVLDKLVLVWASLFSDRALLYRQELGLDPSRSGIAVIVQQLVTGSTSGVAFSRGPTDPDELLIEAVYGLNQGLVDGTVPPHRWHLDRESGRVNKLTSAQQEQALRSTVGAGLRLVDLTPEERAAPPLRAPQLATLHTLVVEVEALFGAPQDVEWTLVEGDLVLLQARPITAGAGVEEDDKRRWHLSLHRTVDNLGQLRDTIESELLPGMAQAADELAAIDLDDLDGAALAAEVRRRLAIRAHWIDAYWQVCIPFAHGMRIFGQVYNDLCKPEDPFEFVELLRGDDLLGTQRNAEMRQLAIALRSVDAGDLERAVFEEQLASFVERFGLSAVLGGPGELDGLVALLPRLSQASRTVASSAEGGREFVERFTGDERAAMAELLELARDSYRLRDDDNIYLGRIEAQLLAAVREATRRVGDQRVDRSAGGSVRELIDTLEDPQLVTLRNAQAASSTLPSAQFTLRARQLVGQPAGPGLAVGRARVVAGADALLSFRQGEVLVCDAIDPNMTFVAPLASAVIERRGGMLIHGAIIAREYGIPCVTGVPDATAWIRTGDLVAVDGHLGLVTISDATDR